MLQSLDESSYAGNLNLQTVGGTMGDHPISWCQNYGGGRAFTQVLGHMRELWYDPAYLRNVLAGIQTAAGVVPANCVSFREVREAASALGATAAGQAGTLLDSAYAAYAPPAKNYAAAVTEIDRLRTLVQQPASGDTAARAKVLAKADELRAWMLSLGADSRDRHRRRHGARHVGPDARRAGHLRRLHPGHDQGLRDHQHGRRHQHRG